MYRNTFKDEHQANAHNGAGYSLSEHTCTNQAQNLHAPSQLNADTFTAGFLTCVEVLT